MNSEKRIKFLAHSKDDFFSSMKAEVDRYFAETGISRHASVQQHVKIVVMFLSWIALYMVILNELFSPLILLACSMSLGVLTGICGINLSHDAAHSAYSASSFVNRLFAYSYDLIGFSSYIWRMTHNGGHHNFTNIAGVDPDIDKPFLLRLSPESPRLWFHRYQNWYIWFLYSLISLNWIYISDYLFFFREAKRIPRLEKLFFFFFKMANLCIFLLIPLFVMSLPWWQILIGYLALQMIGGLSVALIFQLAHLVENTQFPQPDSEGLIHNQWGVHEILTTSNFSTSSWVWFYLLGGLNFQIEHHLFPHIAHTHYRNLSPIVRKTALAFGLPYNEYKSLTAAIISHWRLLKKLGHQ